MGDSPPPSGQQSAHSSRADSFHLSKEEGEGNHLKGTVHSHVACLGALCRFSSSRRCARPGWAGWDPRALPQCWSFVADERSRLSGATGLEWRSGTPAPCVSAGEPLSPPAPHSPNLHNACTNSAYLTPLLWGLKDRVWRCRAVPNTKCWITKKTERS